MKRSNKLLLGIFTFLPFVLSLILIAYVGGIMFDIFEELPKGESPDPELLFANWFHIIGFGASVISVGLLSLAVTIYYIVQAANNQKLDSNLKLIWIFVLLITNGLGAIVYWIMNIWNLEEDEEINRLNRS